MTRCRETYFARGASVFQRLEAWPSGSLWDHQTDRIVCTVHPQFPAPHAVAFQITEALNAQTKMENPDEHEPHLEQP